MLKFLCIGAQKAGTTWMYELLRTNPNVWMPPIKEISYFYELETDFKTDLESRFLSNGWVNRRWRRILIENIQSHNKDNHNDWFYKYLFLKREFTKENMDVYASLFQNDQNLISGDITPNYSIMRKSVVEKIHYYFPDLKIIFCLRNPVYRDFSAMKMDLAKKKSKSYEEIEREKADHYMKIRQARSTYLKTIKIWSELYGDNFNVLVYDELKADPRSFAQKLSDILEVPFDYDESLFEKKVYAGIQQPLPEEYKEELVKKYTFMIRNLVKRYYDNPFIVKWLEWEYYNNAI